MGWKCSLVTGAEWPDSSLDTLMAGYVSSGETTDFDSACIELGDYEIAVAKLPGGSVVGVACSCQEDLASLALMLSSYGKAGEFHLYSTTDYYAYRLYERGRILEDRSSEFDSDDAFGMVDDDDALAMLDEEDGLGPTPLTEDGLLELFTKMVRDEISDDLEVTIYRKQTA